eukprot:c10729_g1_i1.p1 GENE.c10729_g1_i1~~c10729_g1_i1.p1  ORF type:complete len:637 (-),score=125.26 c10729_g1_i1:235-2145(-)
MCKDSCCHKTEADPNLERDNMSPIEHRKCRDVFWLLVFAVAIAGSIVVSSTAVKKGNLDVLRYGISSNGTLCGSGSEIDNSKLVYCVNASNVISTSISYSKVSFGVCTSSCPTTGSEIKNVYKAKKAEFVQATGISESEWEFDDYLLVRTLCVAPTLSVLNRCLLDVSVKNSTALDILYTATINPGNSQLASASQMLLNSYNDIVTTWYVIIACGLGVGLVVSFFWLQLLRCVAGLLVWLTVVSYFVAFIIIDILLASKSGYMQSVDNVVASSMQQKYEDYYKVLFWIFLGWTIISLFVLVFMINRIRLAIALVRESADVLITMPQILFTPLLAMIVFGVIFSYGIFISALLASCGTIADGSLQYDMHLRLLILYHVFFCLWMFFMMHAFHSVTLAGAVAQYYWTRDKDTIHLPVTNSIWRTFVYHLGSVAFGSLILAIVRMIRWAMLYFSHRVKKLTKNNKLVKLVLCCINCCLYCFEKFIHFLTKNAYIMIAVDGHSFCVAAGQAWRLLLSNAARMTAVNVVTIYLFFISKLCVAVVAAICTSIWVSSKFMNYSDGTPDKVSSSFAPSVCAFILAYLVSALFFEVVEFAIDTLLFCFCLDDIRNRQSGEYFASTRLLRFMARAPKIDHLPKSAD